MGLTINGAGQLRPTWYGVLSCWHLLLIIIYVKKLSYRIETARQLRMSI